MLLHPLCSYYPHLPHHICRCIPLRPAPHFRIYLFFPDHQYHLVMFIHAIYHAMLHAHTHTHTHTHTPPPPTPPCNVHSCYLPCYASRTHTHTHTHYIFIYYYIESRHRRRTCMCTLSRPLAIAIPCVRVCSFYFTIYHVMNDADFADDVSTYCVACVHAWLL